MTDTTHKSRESKSASGRFVLRIDPSLHAVLRKAASDAGTSLNEYCARKLASPQSPHPGPAMEAVSRAAVLVGESLVGVVAFGSWARREMAEESDVDLLIIVDVRQEIDRGLYRSWDESPLFWNGHRLEPHFVHLPEAGSRLSGLWAEVSVDGVVLFDRDLSVSERLVEFRREIASGRIHRCHSHGQPYWVGRNADRPRDYMHRAGVRLRALDVLFEAESWADVVREAQEIVELTLKALLRGCGIDPPRIHDVSEVLLSERDRLPKALEENLETLTEISRSLRRDRELAFYGAEDLTPSGFYSRADAEKARSEATLTVELVRPHIG